MERPDKLFNRNYLLQWQGQSISRLGSQGFSVAMQFWIKHATGSASLMGILLMVSSLPAVFLTPIGGAFADRYSRRKIIILSDFLRGLIVLSLSALIFMAPEATSSIIVWLFVVAVFVNVANSFFGPAISATIPDLVPEEAVASANSMGQLSLQLSVFVGQGLGGVLFRILGAPVLFLIDGVTYLFASLSETFVVIPQDMPEKGDGWREQFRQFGRDILEGFRYVWNKGGLREAVFVSAFMAFFAAPFVVLLPFYVEDVLQAREDWYGFILAASGVGTLIGYLIAGALRVSGKTRGRMMMTLIVLQSAGYGLLGLVKVPIAAVGLAFMGGVAGGFVTINITTIVQITTPGQIRGRVVGLLSAISASLTPLSMGLSGIVADLVNQNISLIYVACGVIMVLLTLGVSTNREFRGLLAHESTKVPQTIETELAPLS